MNVKTRVSQTRGTDIPVKLVERIKRIEDGFHPILLDKNELPFELTIQKLSSMTSRLYGPKVMALQRQVR
jgi:hypothetical protein